MARKGRRNTRQGEDTTLPEVGLRDVAFLVADSGMVEMVRGFLDRPHPGRRLGCGDFTFDATADLVVAPTRDSGVYHTARELLRPYERSHRRAVVILDNAWEGSPGVSKIEMRIAETLTDVWEYFVVIVIDPELEAWVWQDNPNVANALKCRSDFRDVLQRHGHWPEGATKPPDPKAALDHLRRRHGADRSNAAFRRLAAGISVAGCADPAFIRLRETLRDWFGGTA
jgi:hypothetical protein